MTATANPHRPIWINTQSRRPLCDVPWFGTVVVLSDGSVNFCCYSSAVVGNVNKESFQEIWNGTVMSEIRQELSEQRLPPQCRSASCPFYRGDERNYIFDRMEGPHSFRVTGTHDPHARVRESLQGSELRVNRDESETGNTVEVSLEFCCRGEPVLADILVAIRYPDGSIRFLPDLVEYAMPFRTCIELREDQVPLQVNILGQGMDCFQVEGDYEICAALIESGSDPNLLSNVYWSESKMIKRVAGSVI